ncbi:MAG: hypothetical protein VX633_14275, partial [Verrucomicrobiota bacterium]|nr:hypothetical protein [Verrucomicrobiota bacterium]
MKTLLSLLILLGVGTTLVLAGPALHLNTSTLTPSTTFKLSFEKPMVPPEKVGTTVPNSLMKIEPPLAGDLKWIEPNVAQFERRGIPAIATSYQFSLLPGCKHLDETVIPETKLRTLPTAPFQFQTSDWRGNVQRPIFFLRFNDRIDPATISGKLSFRDKNG